MLPLCDNALKSLTCALSLAGYWRANNNSLQYFTCLQPAQCNGDTCAGNRKGPLCAECEPGYQGV